MENGERCMFEDLINREVGGVRIQDSDVQFIQDFA